MDSIKASALILMDMWVGMPHLDAHITEIAGMVRAYRDAGGLVIHSPNTGQPHLGIEMEVSDVVLPMSLVGLGLLVRILETHNINHLFYAGYASDACLINRETGVKNLAEKGYEITVISDASDATKPEYHARAIKHIEDTWGNSITIVEFNWWGSQYIPGQVE